MALTGDGSRLQIHLPVGLELYLELGYSQGPALVAGTRSANFAGRVVRIPVRKHRVVFVRLLDEIHFPVRGPSSGIGIRIGICLWARACPANFAGRVSASWDWNSTFQ